MRKTKRNIESFLREHEPKKLKRSQEIDSDLVAWASKEHFDFTQPKNGHFVQFRPKFCQNIFGSGRKTAQQQFRRKFRWKFRSGLFPEPPELSSHWSLDFVLPYKTFLSKSAKLGWKVEPLKAILQICTLQTPLLCLVCRDTNT